MGCRGRHPGLPLRTRPPIHPSTHLPIHPPPPMATNPHIRDQAYQFFLEEAPELLQTIEAGLLALQQQRDTAEIHEIMRAAHSLKGGAPAWA